MALEIERKFLLKGDGWRKLIRKSTRIVQAFLANDAVKAVRVRIMGEQAFLTVKSTNKGATRIEVEREITVADAEQLLPLCLPGTIDKVRHEVPVGNHVFEVDEFHGENEDLVVAEVELGSEDEVFERPDWVGDEVTHLGRYGNSSLINHPYTAWTATERDER